MISAVDVCAACIAGVVGMITLVVLFFIGYTVWQVIAAPIRRRRWRRARIAEFQWAVEKFRATGGQVLVWPDDDHEDPTLTTGGNDD